jgi:hypothetical protein
VTRGDNTIIIIIIIIIEFRFVHFCCICIVVPGELSRHDVWASV